MSELKVHHLVDIAGIATWRNVSINVWVGAPSMELLHRLRNVTREHVALHAGGVVSMTVLVRGGAGLNMGKAERAESENLAREFGGPTKAIAHVILGTGFFMATVRTILAGISLVARTPCGTKVFDRVVDGSEWLAPHAGVNAQELAVVAQELMGRMPLIAELAS